MRQKLALCILVTLAVFLFQAGSAQAGARIQISDDSKIDLGFRLQALYLNTDKDIDSDGDFESFDDFKVRRARIRLGADVTKWVSMFLQTEFSEGAGAGADMRVIDAFVQLKPHKLANLYLGENMAPVLRQNVTSSGALMAIDRPAINSKNLTWGTKAPAAFTNTTIDDFSAGLTGDVDVRDTGLTLFGSDSLNDMVHFKYYAGVYDGVQNADQDSERYAARVQINFFDPEPGYYNLSTYLGEKKTIGLGAAFDTQEDVDADASGNIDYQMFTFDAFVDYPVGPGYLTFESAYIDLDLDGGGVISTGNTAKNSQGKGFYAQAGYFISNWQPWVEYEDWNSDGATGDFDNLRCGLTYFIKGHNANIKAGYETFNGDHNFTGTNEDRINTFVTGLYVTY